MKIVRFVNSIFESNTYLIWDDNLKVCYLIDCGDINPILELINKLNLSLKGIFITHSHFDHIYGLNILIKEYPEVIVYTSIEGKKGLLSDRYNLSRYQADSFVFLYSNNIRVIREDCNIELWDKKKMNIFFTPGHDNSCLTYKIENNLFTGDSFLPEYKLIASFPRSNKEEAIRSGDFIMKLKEGCTIYPGHGDVYL